MAGRAVALGRARGFAADLPSRLRAETTESHELVESAVDIPGRMRTRDDYRTLLRGLAELHAGLETQLAAPELAGAWRSVGVNITDHCRLACLLADLGALGGTDVTPVDVPAMDFGTAMGCLYVLEGSALGGRVVARMVHDALGEVPTTFLTGAGRGRQWPAVRAALRTFDEQGGDGDAVVAGALATFALFTRHLAAADSRR